MPTLKDKYNQEVVPKLMEVLGIRNRLRVPRIAKVVLNAGIGLSDKDVFKVHVEELAKISGQRPVVTKAKKSISNFKLREGVAIGAKVTLRGDRMYEFLERLICAALPRIRDFRGVPLHSFDGRGNYTFGVKEQTIFPEIDPNGVTEVQGMDVTVVTTARTDDEAREMLKLLGVPFSSR
jgi:large subunit ribosomal protein L5